MRKNRVGILGGTFDPIHIGHLIIAENAYEQYDLDEVWFMPSGMPPHKSDRDVTPSEKRSDMVRLAIKENKHFKCSELEMKREGPIYTVDTLKILHERYTETEFYFIIGEDSLDDFEKWREPCEIVKYATILVATRSENKFLREKVSFFREKFKCNADIIVTPYIDVSSSDIRNRVLKQETIKYMVISDVEKYIHEEGLYVKNSGDEKWI